METDNYKITILQQAVENGIINIGSVLDKLVPIYFSKSHIDKLTFHGLYEEWLEFKAAVTNSPNTIKRHGQHYKRYFEGSALHGMKVKGINELLLEKALQ